MLGKPIVLGQRSAHLRARILADVVPDPHMNGSQRTALEQFLFVICQTEFRQALCLVLDGNLGMS